MEWMIICIVVVAIFCFFIGFCIRRNNNRQHEEREVLINANENLEINYSQNNLDSKLAMKHSSVVLPLEVVRVTNYQTNGFKKNDIQNLEISQINLQIESTDKKKKIIKPIRRRKQYIRQLKLIRTKKLKLCRTLKNINKQKEKQIYLGEKQKKINLENKKINLENKKIIQEKKKLAIEENKVWNNIMHTVSIINLKMNFNGETKTSLNLNSPMIDVPNNEINKNKDDKI